jgi:hypothetical protein
MLVVEAWELKSLGQYRGADGNAVLARETESPTPPNFTPLPRPG